MAAAEHGATFPLAQKVRASMTHQQLHDFASGSEAGKPQPVPTRQLHPAMVRHGRLVAEAHQHLHGTVPEYRQASPRQRMLMTQEHVRTRKANGY